MNNPGKPSNHAIAWTPRDDGTLPFEVRCVYVKTDGNINWEDSHDMSKRITPVFAGAVLPYMPSRIYSTDTTATFEIWG